jgi:hypothetical protein
VPIPPRAVVKFKPGKEMKASVASLSARLTASGSSDSPVSPQ